MPLPVPPTASPELAGSRWVALLWIHSCAVLSCPHLRAVDPCAGIPVPTTTTGTRQRGHSRVHGAAELLSLPLAPDGERGKLHRTVVLSPWGAEMGACSLYWDGGSPALSAAMPSPPILFHPILSYAILSLPPCCQCPRRCWGCTASICVQQLASCNKKQIQGQEIRQQKEGNGAFHGCLCCSCICICVQIPL